MKNPFKKQDHSAIIAAIAISTVAAGVLAYLLLTEKGDEIFAELKHKIKDKTKDIASAVISEKTGFSKNNVKTTADIIAK